MCGVWCDLESGLRAHDASLARTDEVQRAAQLGLNQRLLLAPAGPQHGQARLAEVVADPRHRTHACHHPIHTTRQHCCLLSCVLCVLSARPSCSGCTREKGHHGDAEHAHARDAVLGAEQPVLLVASHHTHTHPPPEPALTQTARAGGSEVRAPASGRADLTVLSEPTS